MASRELYIAVFHHEFGTDTFTFLFTPDGELKYPSPRKVVKHFNINFEPEKGETFELIPAQRSDPETLSAAAIGTKTMPSASWWEDGEEGWHDGTPAELSRTVNEKQYRHFTNRGCTGGHRYPLALLWHYDSPQHSTCR